MKNRYYVITLMVLILSTVAYSAGIGSVDKGSISILVKHDSVTIALMDDNGVFKEATFGKDGFGEAKHFLRYDESNPADLHVYNELILDGDKITIDGEVFSCDQIEGMSFAGEFDTGFSFKARFPHDEYKYNRQKKIYIEKKSMKDKFGFGDLIIEAGETIYGDVVAVTGDIKVYGEVMGDVVSVFGDIEMHDGSSAGGDVVAPFGQVIKRGRIQIGGDSMPHKRFSSTYRNSADFNFTTRYNRVEGLTLLSGINYTDKHRELPDFSFDFGYAFSLKRWNFDAGFRQQFADKYAFYFGANVFRGAVTPDEWMISYEENTAATLLFKEDFHDFYHHKGFKGYMGQNLGHHVYFQAEFFAQENEALTKTTNKAIFGGKKNFRENYSTVMTDPGVLESINGKRRMLAVSFNWDNRDDECWPRSGQLVKLRYETAGDGQVGNLGGDQSFDIAYATFANYLPLTRKQHIGLRLQAGHSDQNLPLDKWFFLGGIGSLRGYDYKEFAGNRYFLANLDYYFEFSSGFSLALFGDLGKAGFSETEFKDNDLNSDVGVGVIFEDAFRLDIAQRMDDTDKNPIVRGRFMLHF
ncbi:MAG: BamA/TamA family outer membrane protein [candidate division Zixibacteria bacterium]|nr:BamA/TamA family outer membrane protein [candidate division Zixibacteria bacterium]